MLTNRNCSARPRKLRDGREVFDAWITEQLTGAAAVLGRYHPDGSSDRDLVDLAVGVKWDVLDIQAPFTAHVLIPLNKNTGLRPDFTWSAGFEFTF